MRLDEACPRSVRTPSSGSTSLPIVAPVARRVEVAINRNVAGDERLSVPGSHETTSLLLAWSYRRRGRSERGRQGSTLRPRVWSRCCPAHAMTKANATRRLVRRHAFGHSPAATIKAPLNSVSTGRLAPCNHDGGGDCIAPETGPQVATSTRDKGTSGSEAGSISSSLHHADMLILLVDGGLQ